MANVTIWTEKYRPKDFSEVKGQDRIVSKVEALVKQNKLPHLLFAGPPGTGVLNPLTTEDVDVIERLSTVELSISRILPQGKLAHPFQERLTTLLLVRLCCFFLL